MDIHKQVLNLFNDQSGDLFSSLALKLFRYQAEHNSVYNSFLKLINVNADSITNIDQIPLLPISVFKNREVKTGDWEEEKIFLSSGTGNMVRSKNYVRNLSWYDKISQTIFNHQIGELKDYKILAFLPSYMDNPSSSLIHMVNHFFELSKSNQGNMFSTDIRQLKLAIDASLKEESRDILLIGVTFALIDFARGYYLDSARLNIMFTGGMKNRGQELTYDEVCQLLCKTLPSSKIFAEYGMTELCSQAYSINGNYKMPPTMRIIAKDITDPLSNAKTKKTARLGIIDLANIDTCAFILTEDLGLVDDNHFEVIGRLDQSDLRGCNMLFHS